jgi:hypothetical protein
MTKTVALLAPLWLATPGRVFPQAPWAILQAPVSGRDYAYRDEARRAIFMQRTSRCATVTKGTNLAAKTAC